MVQIKILVLTYGDPEDTENIFRELDYTLFVHLIYEYVRHRFSLHLINIHTGMYNFKE